jgi:hypothetical protein
MKRMVQRGFYRNGGLWILSAEIRVFKEIRVIRVPIFNSPPNSL